jgi:hypothetical protein
MVGVIALVFLCCLSGRSCRVLFLCLSFPSSAAAYFRIDLWAVEVTSVRNTTPHRKGKGTFNEKYLAHRLQKNKESYPCNMPWKPIRL